MSTYGSASAVTVVPHIASQQFRDSLAQELPACLTLPSDETLTAASVTEEVNSAVAHGLLSTLEAHRCAAVIGGLQRTEVASAAASTLADLGFHVRLTPGVTSSIWAEREHVVMALEVHDGGGFAFDLAGLDDGTCHTILEQFQAGMTSRGVTYTATASTHNDPRGGQLIRRVTRATGRRNAAATTKSRGQTT